MDKQQAIKRLTNEWLNVRIIEVKQQRGMADHGEWMEAYTLYRGYRRALIEVGIVSWEDVGDVENIKLTIETP